MRRTWTHKVVILLSTLYLGVGAVPQHAQQRASVGRLIVTVAYPNSGHTPAMNAFVSVHGYPFTTHYSGSTTILVEAEPGQYEALLPEGVYDIQVSEASSYPQCKRIEIVPGQKEVWAVKLETDHSHLEK